MMSWAGWPRLWRYIAIFVVVATINVGAFFSILRVGSLLNPISRDTATASFSARPDSEVIRQLQHPSWRNSSDGRQPAVDASESLGLNSNQAYDQQEQDNRDGIDPNRSFFVCIPILIGDDSSNPPADALPFPLLYRLFDSAKEEISKKFQDDGEKSKHAHPSSAAATNFHKSSPIKVLVVVDFPSLVCKIARDAFHDAGPEFQAVELTCLALKELPAAELRAIPAGGREGRKLGAGTQSLPLQRVPPLFCNTIVIGKSTRSLPQLSLEWLQFMKWSDVKVVDLDASDPSRAPPRLPKELWRPTAITAFSSNHLAVGLLLLRSLGRAAMELATAGQYNLSIVAYTLEDFDPKLRGLIDCVVRELNENFSVPTELREFDFSLHPDWMRVNQSMGYEGTGKWAWKAVMMHELLVERGFVLWTDAGCRYTESSLSETLNYTRDFGFASKLSVGVVPQYVHPGQIKYFGYQVKYAREERVRNCDTSGIGLTLDTYESIGRPFYDCSVTRQCIGPDGATRDDHRFEQAAMTLIADMNGTSCKGLSAKVRRHMDYHPKDYSGTYPTQCYKDPLAVPGA